MDVTGAEEWILEIGAETAVTAERPFFTLPLIPGQRLLAETLAEPGLEVLTGPRSTRSPTRTRSYLTKYGREDFSG